METCSLMKMLLDAGYPKTELRHYCSSLFVYPSELVNEVLNKYCEENGVHREDFIMMFYDSFSGKMMLELCDKYNPALMGSLQ